MMLRLEILAITGNSPVSNAFTQEADRLGLTPKGREKKEREEQRKFAAALDALRRQVAEFLKRLDLIEQATAEALRENDEHLAVAREELRRVRERAYEITMPDGTVAKVYRDGDKVRTDAGAEIAPDVVRAEDIPDGSSTWRQRKGAGDAIARLEAERAEIIDYQKRLGQTRDALSRDDVTGEQLSAMQSDAARMPEAVRRRYNEGAGEPRPETGPAGNEKETTFRTRVDPTRAFTSATQGTPSAPPDQDFLQIPPSVSMPAPR
jgi:hypothetical protein